MLEYINPVRARGRSIADAAVDGAVLRLRLSTMTMGVDSGYFQLRCRT